MVGNLVTAAAGNFRFSDPGCEILNACLRDCWSRSDVVGNVFFDAPNCEYLSVGSKKKTCTRSLQLYAGAASRQETSDSRERAKAGRQSGRRRRRWSPPPPPSSASSPPHGSKMIGSPDLLAFTGAEGFGDGEDEAQALPEELSVPLLPPGHPWSSCAQLSRDFILVAEFSEQVMDFYLL